MGMSRAELEAAIASVSKMMERMGYTAEQTTQSMKEVARRISDYTKYTGNIVCGANNLSHGVDSTVTGVQHQPIKEGTVTGYPSNPLKEEKKDTMLDTEYTTVYSELKTDWDEPKTTYVNMSEV